MDFNKKARLFTMPVVMDPEVEGAYVQARNKLDMRQAELLKTFPGRAARAREMGGDAETVAAEDQAELDVLIAERDEAEKALDAVTVPFKFRALGRKKHRELINAHPATREQKDAAKEAGEEVPHLNHETFAPAIIAAAIVSPALSAEQVYDLFDSDEWNAKELDLLYVAANNPQFDVGQYSR